ncbi:MAG: 2-C-methyl-D-erythritol 2,4-cyclodiphosphate synthase [Bacteroidetes bacterium]|jgi:2-C-methyl-D-erythritol 2,4-cyclodiphosphate synthase|nr:2-C-methyl-D-erythritol 2,4-cyclodiphosphate synthase [Bacteroidota bacterium]
MRFRVGFGFDVHQLTEGRDLIVGGVKIPHSKGALGHSDADVLIHAICDALLGAAGLKDIGTYFPDTSAEFKGIDSKILLDRVVKLLSEKGYTIGNVDSSLVLEQPKIKPYIDQMRNTLAPILRIQEDEISIKATTNEKMGFIGREEGVAAYAVCMIEKKV